MALLETDNLYVTYTSGKGLSSGSQTVKAVNGVNLDLRKGEILAVAGESGCGKSTLAKSIMKLIPIKSGEIFFKGKNLKDIKSGNDIKDFYKKVQMIFQNPYSSLNPKMTIRQILSEPLVVNTKYNKPEINNIIRQKLYDVGLNESILDLYPHEFSGGQRQRIAIARAMVLEPEIIIADEPVSALDVSIQAQIINLIKDINKKQNITFLFISHDLSVIRHISDRIVIMYLGEIVEQGLTEEIFKHPKHPYTQALLSSVPQLGVNKQIQDVKLAQGELPSPNKLPQGCKFHTRCPYVMEKCKIDNPSNVLFSDFHQCRCFLYSNK